MRRLSTIVALAALAAAPASAGEPKHSGAPAGATLASAGATPASAGATPTSAGATPAPAAAPKNLAVVRPRLVGADTPALAEQIATLLTAGLAEAPVRRLPAADVARVTASCADAACIQPLHDALQADLILQATLTMTGRDFGLVLELLAAPDGALVARSAGSCDLCGRGELQAQVTAQLQQLQPALRAAAADPPRLQVATDPPGAQVHVDGQLVGVAPYDEEVLVGAHTLRVTYPRHSPIERPFVAGPTPTRQQLELRRSPATMRLRAGGWVMLVTGVATIAGGAALLVIDGRCTSDARDGTGACPRLYDTDWGGAGLMTAGAGLATAGVVALIWTRKRTGRGPRVTPRASRTGAGVALAWRF